MLKRHQLLLLFPAGFLICLQASAQISDTLWVDSITVSAPRLQTPFLKTPISLTRLDEWQFGPANQNLALNEVLDFLPGVFAMNAGNYAQDLRVSVRGFGARAGFGIRGVQLLVDGFPESTPDGQTQLDNLDIGFIQKGELMRGPSSVFYGNASGGVISLQSAEPSRMISAEAGAGSYGYHVARVKAGNRYKNGGFLVNGLYNGVDGYRNQSRARNWIFNGKLNSNINPDWKMGLVINYADSPVADDPGALIWSEVSINRQQARDRNIQFKAGESIQQGRLGIWSENKLSEKQLLISRLFYINRQFEGYLPVAGNGLTIFSRNFTGANVAYQFSSGPYRLQAGIDLARQADDRQRLNNDNGSKGNLTADQLEIFANLAAFLLQEFSISERLSLQAGVRYDNIKTQAQDHFLLDGQDNSGERILGNWSPQLGINYRFTWALSGFGLLSTSFESPTLNELSNNPAGVGGFNFSLEPQRATNLELGFKGFLPSQSPFEITFFWIKTRNEIVPYELDARVFYQNAGKSERKGMEASLMTPLLKNLDLLSALTVSDFKYTNYALDGKTYDGNQLPGIPNLLWSGECRYQHPNGFYAKIQGRYVSNMFADDANATKVSSYTLANLKAGYSFQLKNSAWSPYIGINNLFGIDYYDNIRINAAGNRYYEPAPARNVYAGVRMELGGRVP